MNTADMLNILTFDQTVLSYVRAIFSAEVHAAIKKYLEAVYAYEGSSECESYSKIEVPQLEIACALLRALDLPDSASKFETRQSRVIKKLIQEEVNGNTEEKPSQISEVAVKRNRGTCSSSRP